MGRVCILYAYKSRAQSFGDTAAHHRSNGCYLAAGWQAIAGQLRPFRKSLHCGRSPPIPSHDRRPNCLAGTYIYSVYNYLPSVRRCEMRHIGDPDTSYPRDIANHFIPRSFVGLILVATWSTALAVPIRVQSHGVTLLIPKPVGISSASSRLTNGIQAVGVMPGEQLLALFVNRDKPGHSPPAIKMMQVVTSINGRHVPISLRAFAKQNSKSKKAISAY